MSVSFSLFPCSKGQAVRAYLVWSIKKNSNLWLTSDAIKMTNTIVTLLYLLSFLLHKTLCTYRFQCIYWCATNNTASNSSNDFLLLLTPSIFSGLPPSLLYTREGSKNMMRSELFLNVHPYNTQSWLGAWPFIQNTPKSNIWPFI